jgi:hypothetical protein
MLNIIGNCDQYLRYHGEKSGKEAKIHSNEMSIHLGSTNLSWFDIARDEIARTTLLIK